MDPSADANRRVRQLLQEYPGTVWGVRLLTAVEILLAGLILGVGALIIALFVTGGVTTLGTRSALAAPPWLAPRIPPALGTGVQIADTGLTPVIVANRGVQSPWVHRTFARVLQGVVGRLTPLQANVSALLLLLAVGLGLLIALVAVHSWRRRLAIGLAAETGEQLRHLIHRQVYRLGQSALPNEGIGPVLNLFTREVNDVRDGLLAGLDRQPLLVGYAVACLLVGLLISWPVMVGLLIIAALGFLAARATTRASQLEASEAARDAAVQLCLLHEDLGLVRTVRVYGMERFDNQRFDEHLHQYTLADRRRLRTEGRVRPTLMLVIGLAAGVVLALLGFVILTESRFRLSVAAAAALLACVAGVIVALQQWSSLREPLRRAGRSAAAIFEYLDRKPELLMPAGASFLAPLRKKITFENVSIEGRSGRPILSGIAAEIQAGTRNALIGLDESSKLALACLIPRLIDPTVGRIRIDGTDLRDITLESLRAQVATVLQADLIFSDTVAVNIGLGDPSYTLPRIMHAAKMAHAHNFIRDLPQGYDTLLGPLGHYLRPDEQYRIALARAYLHDPAIVIIEEPPAHLDEEVKAMIDDTIDRLAEGRTLLFLPHRLSTVRRCDQVILLHNGRIEAAGPPRDLQRASKLYRHIQYVQFSQFANGELEPGSSD